MSNEKVRYILDNFLGVMDSGEFLPIIYVLSKLKNNESGHLNILVKDSLKKHGLLANNQDYSDLSKEGLAAFEQKIAIYISEKHPAKVYFNNCPKCAQLARTPFAKQCRHCRFDWH